MSGQIQIEIPREKVADFCRRHHIRKLSLFGSVLRDDFGPDSDVDVLVEFEREAEITILDIIQMEEELTALLSHKVDLVDRLGLRNPFLRHRNLENTGDYICHLNVATRLIFGKWLTLLAVFNSLHPTYHRNSI